MKNALGALGEAIEVLSKVQLMQKQGKGDSHQVGQMLLQVKNIVTRSNLQHHEAHFHNVMQLTSGTSWPQWALGRKTFCRPSSMISLPWHNPLKVGALLQAQSLTIPGV